MEKHTFLWKIFNMNLIIEKIKGLQIENFKEVEDYFQIAFKDNVILTIYNDISIVGIDLKEAESLKGLLIENVVITDDFLELWLSNNFVIKIDLRDVAYHYPEAMILYLPNKQIITW